MLDAAAAAAYPAHREADVALRDGSTVHVRPVRPDDEPAVRAFYGGLSVESRAFRFFTAGANLDQAARQGVVVDYRDRYALIATVGHDHRVIGHAIYVRRTPPAGGGMAPQDGPVAESAFAVADDFQGRGLGTILL